MHHRKHEYDYKGVQTTEAVIEQLEMVLEGLKKGTLAVDDGEGRFELTPTNQTKFSMEMKETHHSQTLKLKLKWKDLPEATTWETRPLKILS